MPKGNTALKIVAWVVRVLTGVIIFSVAAFLLWRIAISGTPSELAGISPNQTLADAYRENETLTLFYQDQSKITRGKDNSGYFSALDPVFIKEADQFQVVFRYNNSTIRALAEDYKLDKVPDRSEELYDVSLIIVTDRTPENDEDDLLKENTPESMIITRVFPTASETVRLEKNLYNYRKLVFDGVVIDEDTLGVYLDIHYVGDIRYNNEGFDVYRDRSYGALCVYDFLTENLDRALSGSEEKAIREFKAR